MSRENLELVRRIYADELFDREPDLLVEQFAAADAFRARKRGSDREVLQDEVHTWTLRDGKIVRFEWGRDLASALARIGITKSRVLSPCFDRAGPSAARRRS